MKNKTPIIRLRRFKDMCCEFEKPLVNNAWCRCIVNDIGLYMNTYVLYLSDDDLKLYGIEPGTGLDTLDTPLEQILEQSDENTNKWRIFDFEKWLQIKASGRGQPAV